MQAFRYRGAIRDLRNPQMIKLLLPFLAFTLAAFPAFGQQPTALNMQMDRTVQPYPICANQMTGVGGCMSMGTMSAAGLFALNPGSVTPAQLSPITPGLLGYAGSGTGGVTSLTTLPSGMTIPGSTLTGTTASASGALFRNLQETTDTSLQNFGGVLLVTSPGTNNAIVGAVLQDGSNGNTFPTGVTGFGKLNNAGNQAFGLFGQCQSVTVGTCSNELDATNNVQAPNMTFPPNLAFGTTSAEILGLQIVANGTYQSKAGISMGSSVSGGLSGFVAGAYLSPLAASQYGVFVDASTTNSATQAGTFKTVGLNGQANIVLQYTGASPSSGSSFLYAEDNNANQIVKLDVFGNLQLGNFSTLAASTTPIRLLMDGTYSSVAGANPKMIFFNGAGTQCGIGYSVGEADYICTPGSQAHAFWLNGSEVALLNASGLTLPSLSTNGVVEVSSGLLSSAVTLSGGLGGTGVANTGKTITVGGNFSTSAALSISAGTSGQLAYWSSGTAIGGATVGTGVITALGNPVNANGGLVGYGGSAGALGITTLMASSTISGTAHIATGTVPIGTTGSCSASSFVGGATAGKFTAPACSAGTIVISGLPAAPNGYHCTANDWTTPADNIKQTSATTTSATFIATTAASDIVSFGCEGF